MSIIFNGNVILQKANPPKDTSPYDWSIDKSMDINIHCIFDYIDKNIGDGSKQVHKYEQREYTIKNVWAVAGLLSTETINGRSYEKLTIYGSTPKMNGVYSGKTSTEVVRTLKEEYFDGREPWSFTTTDTLNVELTDSNIGSSCPNTSFNAKMEPDSYSISGGFPIFFDKNKMDKFLKGDEPLDDDVPTNGYEGSEEVPTNGTRKIQMNYAGANVAIADGIVEIVHKPYRQGVYAIPVKDNNGSVIYLPVIMGSSWNGGSITYNANLNNGEYKMIDNAVENEYFPNLDCRAEYDITNNIKYYYSENVPIEKGNNGTFYYSLFDNGINYGSIIPAMYLPYEEWDTIETTFTCSVPMFDTKEKLVKYLLGEIDEDEAVTNEIPDDTTTETDNNIPKQNMISGEGVNFTS